MHKVPGWSRNILNCQVMQNDASLNPRRESRCQPVP